MKNTPNLNEILRLIFEACPAAMLLVDLDGVIELANQECVKIFGHPQEQMIGATVETLIPERLRGGHVGFRAGFAATPAKRMMGVGRDLTAMRADGSEFYIEVGLMPIEGPHGPRIIVFAIDVTHRRETEHVLRRALEELQHANDSLSRFAYVASHDIQEPLRKIAAFADILSSAMRVDDAEEAAYAAQVMAASAQHARQLVSDLLSYARAANQPNAPEPVSLSNAMDRALESLSQTILDEKAEVDRSGEDFIVLADKAQLHQILTNILSNALKYHRRDESPRVRIRLRSGESENRLTIEDEGIGFTPAEAQQIFEPFRRLHARGDYPGTGIGLAICKTVAEKHHWRLAAQSTPLVGSSFEIAFPLAAAHATPPD